MTPESTSHSPPSLYFPWIASAIAIIVASLVLVGWLLDMALLQSVLPGAATMKPNTAVCFVLCGLALWLLCPASGQARGGMRPVVARACVTLVAGVGLLTLGEYGLDLNTGIDELLFRETLTATQLPYPGRMAPATALNFLLLGLSLTVLDAESRHGHRPSQYVALGVILVGLLALLGYLYGVPALYQVFAYVSMALHTSLLFLVLGGGALWARPDRGLMATITSDYSGGWMARRLLPVAISLPIVIAWLLWRGERIGLYETAFGLALFVMSNIVSFTVVFWLSARSLNRADVERRQTEEVIRQTAAELQYTHAQLRLSEERLRLAVTGAGLGTWHWDLSTDTLVWSDSCLALFGLPPGTSMRYAMFLAALHSADRARVDATVRRVLADRSEYDIEYRTVWPDGSTHWIASKGRGYYDVAGQPLRMEGVVMDITMRTQTALALHESEERFRLVVESAPNGIVMVDQDGLIVLVNCEVERAFGYRREELLGAPVEVLLPAALREQHVMHRRTFWSQPVARRMGMGRDLAGRHKDGSAFPIEVGLAPIEMTQGTGVLATVIDITQRKQAEDKVHVAQARLQAALAGGGMGTWLLDIPQGQIEWDEAALRLFGRTREELAAGPIETFLSWVHPDDRAHAHAALEATIREGSDYDVESRLIRPDGVVLWIAGRGHVERDAHGQPWHMMGVCVDITARKQSEEELRQAQKMEALGTLAGGIAHDFNNILAAIMGNTKLAILAVPPDAPVQRNLAQIDQASKRAADLVRRILTFGRQQDMPRQVMPLQPVVEEALQLLRATLPAMIDIRTHFASHVPNVAIEATHIHQILINLGVNAAHAMGSRGGLLDVRVEAVTVDANTARISADLQAGPYVRLSVSDNGHGMDQATLARIFEPFFTTKPSGQGTGLGLSVVYGIMQQHGGAITAYSEPGKGTMFQVYFPAADTAATAQLTPHEDMRGHDDHIIYVDDEATLVFLMTQLLELLGYHVTGCTEAAQALQAFQTRPHDFHAVITDLAMPGMSGLELASALLHIRPDVPIVLASGYISPEDRAAAQRLGIRHLILKPNLVQELAQMLHSLLVEQRRGKEESNKT